MIFFQERFHVMLHNIISWTVIPFLLYFEIEIFQQYMGKRFENRSSFMVTTPSNKSLAIFRTKLNCLSPTNSNLTSFLFVSLSSKLRLVETLLRSYLVHVIYLCTDQPLICVLIVCIVGIQWGAGSGHVLHRRIQRVYFCLRPNWIRQNLHNGGESPVRLTSVR